MVSAFGVGVLGSSRLGFLSVRLSGDYCVSDVASGHELGSFGLRLAGSGEVGERADVVDLDAPLAAPAAVGSDGWLEVPRAAPAGDDGRQGGGWLVPGSDLVRAVRAYVAAWNTPDDAARRRLLEEAFAEDGCYLDPVATVVGREALVVHARRFAQRRPGAIIALTSGIAEHSGSACFTWRVIGPDGAALREGIDFVSVDAEGRLCRVIGFFGEYRSPHPGIGPSGSLTVRTNA